MHIPSTRIQKSSYRLYGRRSVRHRDDDRVKVMQTGYPTEIVILAPMLLQRNPLA